jgi:uncharacterized protein YqjF (DUF2071 family)
MRTPDSEVSVPLVRQSWRSVGFVHWPYPIAAVQPLLPAGITVDSYDGLAWVSLTPLMMSNVRLAGTPPMPLLSRFPETNLRTYVLGPDGDAGLWFFSLDAASTWITVAARVLLGAPYFRSHLRISGEQELHYQGVRGHRSDICYDLRLTPRNVAARSDLDIWLTHRWRSFTQHAGRLFEIPVRHEPWPLQPADITSIRQTMTRAAGLPEARDAPFAHFSPGVEHVVFGPPRALSAHQPGR